MHAGEDFIMAFGLLVPLLGLLTGSFLNVCIFRMPRGESIIFPSSRCGKCQTRLGVKDLVPVFSHLSTGGRCRYCGVPVRWRYSIVELLTMVAFIISWRTFGPTALFVVNTALLSALIVISFIDLDVQIIPDEISIGGSVVGLLLALLVSLHHPYANPTLSIGFLDSLLGFSAGFFLLWSISAATGGAMGGGDVKLAGMLGAFFGVKGVLICLLLACIFGALAGGGLMLIRLKGRKDLIPFGPFIAIGAVCIIFAGADRILDQWFLWLKF